MKMILRPAPVSNSLPTRVDYSLASGFNATKEYSYDALNRVTQITNNDSIFTLNITYKGLDTAIYTSQWYHGQRYVDERTFNIAGDHLTTEQIFFNPGGDTLHVARFYFSYNALHQAQSILTFQVGYLNEKPSSPGFSDSSIYHWNDGNVTQISGKVASPNGVFEYVPNTNGQFEFNTPSECAAYLYNTVAKPVLSKNLISRVTENNGNIVKYSYGFGDYGRVRRMIIDGSGSYLAGVYTFHYKCL